MLHLATAPSVIVRRSTSERISMVAARSCAPCTSFNDRIRARCVVQDRAKENAQRRRASRSRSSTTMSRIASGYVSIGTMQLATGLEFRAMAVMAYDDEIIPCGSGSRLSVTTQTCRRSTTPRDICSMSPAPAQETNCKSQPSSRHPNFLDDLRAGAAPRRFWRGLAIILVMLFESARASAEVRVMRWVNLGYHNQRSPSADAKLCGPIA
jgi:hypothetical protein